MNKKAQGGLLAGIFIAIFCIILLMSVTPALEGVIKKAKGCDSFNCESYVDDDATAADSCVSGNRTYDPSQETNDMGCVTIGLTNPLLILGVLFAIIMAIMSGRSLMPEPEPQYYSQ